MFQWSIALLQQQAPHPPTVLANFRMWLTLMDASASHCRQAWIEVQPAAAAAGPRICKPLGSVFLGLKEYRRHSMYVANCHCCSANANEGRLDHLDATGTLQANLESMAYLSVLF